MNNSTAIINASQYLFPSYHPGLNVNYYPFKIALLLFLMVSGLACNILVIFAITKNRHLRKSINFFILSMAISDLFIPIFSIPLRFQMIVMSSYEWLVGGVVGDILCKLLHFFSDLSPLISNLSLVFMTLDRFIAIVYPTKFNLRTPTFRKRLVILSWLIPTFYCAKNFYSYKTITINSFLLCGELWSPNHSKISTDFMTAYTVCFVYFPFIFLTVMYSIIICTLRRQHLAHRNDITSRLQQNSRQKQRRRIITLALAIVLAYMICNGPMNYLYIMQSFVHRWVYVVIMPPEARFLSFALSYSIATVNPLICIVFHREMRMCVSKMMCCNLKCLRGNKTFKLKPKLELDTLEIDKRTTVTTSSIRNISDIGIEMGFTGEETRQQGSSPQAYVNAGLI